MTVCEVIEAFARGATSGAASKCKYYPQGRLRIEELTICYKYNRIFFEYLRATEAIFLFFMGVYKH
jgi:hypothetical protein